jgi:hypothetical protein
VATTAGISGEMIRDMMVRCVEQRFGTIRAPHPKPTGIIRQRPSTSFGAFLSVCSSSIATTSSIDQSRVSIPPPSPESRKRQPNHVLRIAG